MSPLPPLSRSRRRARAKSLLVGALLVSLAVVPSATAASAATAGAAPSGHASEQAAGSRAVLMQYARHTWASFVAMTDEHSGLPADSLDEDGTRSVQTSTTNIGAYMWSALVAERLGIIGHHALVARLTRTVSTLETMERHEPSGQYYNWYDHRTGEKLTTWPPTGDPVVPQLSSVDNGWLATALHLVARSVPEVSQRAGALFDSMDFGFYYRPDVNRILFSYQPSTGDAPCCYDTAVSESRIAGYLGIAKGEIPPKEYFGQWRTFPDTCDWSWQETRPVGDRRRLYGVDVFDGAYPYAGTRVTPAWGGSMFEALMPALFVPEDVWGAGSWRENHRLWVRGQVHHGLREAGYGYWGFSPSNNPAGGYKAYGVDALGMDPTGYPSNNDDTTVDPGFAGCSGRDPQPAPTPADYTNGVVTPHAAFLAMRWAPAAALDDLAALRDHFDVYDRWGFHDSVNVDTGQVSDAYLSLDQGMIMAAIGNALADDMLRRAFATPRFAHALRPVMATEEFNDDPRGCTVTGTPGDDDLHGTPGDDVICALGGDDRVSGGGGDDVVFGDAGDDRLTGAAGNDVLYGDAGDDRISGGTGDDVMSGGPGDDRISGGTGHDHAEGGVGDDGCSVSGDGTTRDCP